MRALWEVVDVLLRGCSQTPDPARTACANPRVDVAHSAFCCGWKRCALSTFGSFVLLCADAFTAPSGCGEAGWCQQRHQGAPGPLHPSSSVTH